MTTYDVTATREGRWWVLTVPDLGIAAQVHRLDEADEVSRSVVAAYLDICESDVAVDVSVLLPEATATLLAEAARDEDAARSALADAGAKRRSAVVSLLESGMTQREAARVLGLSPQRINQLVSRP